MINELTSEILFRCPCCQKLFCTESHAVENHDNRSAKNTEFQCTDCSEDFYLSNERTTSGLFQTLKRTQHEFVNCTKCNFLKNKKSDECPSCGVIETRYKDIVKLENPRLFELNQMWSSVVMDLENDQAHQEFLSRAQSMSALNFAAQKYIDLQKIMGSDDLTEKYIRQVELRLEAAANNFISAEKEKYIREGSGPKTFFGLQYTFRNMALVISLLGVFFIILNVMRPLFPSLNGLLVAIVALSTALWAISKNQTKTF
ncbi:MAG: hypothetical protein H7235_09160 [Bdellovibrionaceae bacterium]|nr:hypothetical protein [Pseudobdellovibrionaceae bacterium]